MRTSPWIVLVALLAVAVGARADSASAGDRSLEVVASGDRVIVHWGDVPATAVEQEVLLSIDGGRHWAEIARPASIHVRRIEFGVPRGVDAVLRFAVRVGDEMRELGEVRSDPVELVARADPADSLISIGGWRAGRRPVADPGPGGELPPVLEPGQQESLERLQRMVGPTGDGGRCEASRRLVRSGVSSIPAVNPTDLPLEYPLQN